jgi:hypothetical protein
MSKQEVMNPKRPVHRYDREERFRKTLDMLLGFGNGIDEETLEGCKALEWETEINEGTIWEVVRKYLKKEKKRKYYNKIPWIIDQMGYDVLKGYEWKKYCWILQDFEEMHRIFNKSLKGKIYFPNMRFICFKLMEKYGIGYRFRVPLIRTNRKRKRLLGLWENLDAQSKYYNYQKNQKKNQEEEDTSGLGL